MKLLYSLLLLNNNNNMLTINIYLPDGKCFGLDIDPIPKTPEDESKFLDGIRETLSKADNIELPCKLGQKLILWGETLKNSYILATEKP